ncbi:transcriptional regulator [Paraburkholderia caffeinitolerans]|nr:transcriptional regulator [Paraburkholderia caffeinitolerans]
MNAPIRYKGYEVAPSAQRLPNGLYAANLTIGPLAATQTSSQAATASGASTATPARTTDTLRCVLVSFDALDYFFDERHALAYACRWARMWIDERRRCA